MEFFEEKNGTYKIIKNNNEIILNGYEILEMAQQVIKTEYPNIELDIEDYLLNKQATFDKLLDEYENITGEQIKEAQKEKLPLFRYSTVKERMLLISDSELESDLLEYDELYIKKENLYN